MRARGKAEKPVTPPKRAGLTDTQIRTTKPAARPVRLYDERGLYLKITLNGGRCWWFKFRFAGKGKLLSMRTYPDTPLKTARHRRDRARALLEEGVDPCETRRAEKASRSEAVARMARNDPSWADKFGPCSPHADPA